MLFNPIVLFLDQGFLIAIPHLVALLIKFVHIAAHIAIIPDHPDILNCPISTQPPQQLSTDKIPLVWETGTLIFEAYLKFNWPEAGYLPLVATDFAWMKTENGVFLSINTECAYITALLKRPTDIKQSETFIHLSKSQVTTNDEHRLCLLLNRTNRIGLEQNGTFKSLIQETLSCYGYERMDSNEDRFIYLVGQLIIRRMEFNQTRDPTLFERFENYLLTDLNF